MEQFTIRDFSGGLNTAMDEANLPANMTASILNVDFLDSKAISRRNGYSLVTATPMDEDSVVALYRYYKKDSSRWWVGVCGTALYARQYVSTTVPLTRLESERAYGTGYATYLVEDTSFSGGYVMRFPVATSAYSATFTVPYSTNITLGIQNTANVVASVWIDGTLKTAITATADTFVTRSYGSLTATSHAFRLKWKTTSGTGTSYVDYFDYSAVAPFTKYSTTLTASTDQFAFATLDDNCYFSSAYDQLSKFDGSTVTAITATNTPSCAFLAVKGRRMFGAGSATDPSKLYYSELDDAEDWGKSGTQNGIYLAGQDAGGTCTGLAVANDLLYYFSQSRTYGLDTRGLPANWEARCLSESHGCVAPNSIAVAPNGVIFLSSDGVRSHGTVQGVYSDDGSAFVTLSDNIKPTIMAHTDAEKAAAIGAVYKNRYWLSLGDYVYVCDLEKRTANSQPPWTVYDNHPIASMCVTRSDEYGLYAGGKADGGIYALGWPSGSTPVANRTLGHILHLDTGGNDYGTSIAMLYRTPPIAPKGYTSVKHFKHTHIAAEAPQAQSVTVGFLTDDVYPSSITASFDADNDIQPKRLLTPARGRSAQVRLSSWGLEQDLTISELTVTYNPRPKVR